MNNDCKTYQHPLERDGTSQPARHIAQREPQSIALMNMDSPDWLNLARSLAAHLRWHDPEMLGDKSKDWMPFWPNATDQAELWRTLEKRQDVPPHLALYLSFLKLLEESKNQFNGITAKHLDFYFHEVLQMNYQPPQADQVHVHFELAKRIESQRIEMGRLLDAKKDGLGKPRYYALENELIVNRATIQHLRHQTYIKGQGLFYAPIANSSDGLGSALPEENPQWQAFGGNHLPKGRIGWAVAAKELFLSEGKRNIVLDINFSQIIPEITNKIAQHFQVYLSGETGWVGPYYFSGEAPTGWQDKWVSSQKGDVRLFLELSEEEEAIVAFDEAIHEEAYQTDLPLMRMILDDEIEDSHVFYEELANTTLNHIQLSTWVRGIRNFTVENDNGVLNPAKPFQPFGPLPKVGSNVYIGNPEMFIKNWQSVDLHLSWRDDIPSNFKKHYESYAKAYVHENGSINTSTSSQLYASNIAITPAPDRDDGWVTGKDYFKINTAIRRRGVWDSNAQDVSLFNDSALVLQKGISGSSISSIDQNKNQKEQQRSSRGTQNLRDQTIQNELYGKGNHGRALEPEMVSSKGKQAVLLETESWSSFPKQGFIKLQLRQHFFHHTYAELLALSKVENPSKPAVPSLPYTPTLESLKLDYLASTKQSFAITGSDKTALSEDFYDAKIQLFHDHPFGQTQEHQFIKWQQRHWVSDLSERISCVPSYQDAGSLLIGLKDIEAHQQISLLFQFAEGSENPLRDPLTTETNVKWFVLCANAWKPLQSSEILLDSTEEWLKSGIIRLKIPAEITTENSLMESGFTWLRAQLKTPLDAVCKLRSIHPHGATAKLVVDENIAESSLEGQALILDHIENGLAGTTIKALKHRLAGIQKVAQPYPSFGGQPLESSSDFYQRASERLRHKDRAVNIWDFEHLVLQQFPEVYKVKCLSHSDVNSGNYLRPGQVSVVVIPKINPQNAHDRLRPQAGRQLRNAIDDFLSKRISKHVSVASVNAQFEEVTITAKIAFHTTFDANFYLNVLQEDLRVYLSPWAANAETDINFGGTIYRTGIVRFLENLEYVDYLSDLVLSHKDVNGDLIQTGSMRSITASTAASILVSASQHNLTIHQAPCP